MFTLNRWIFSSIVSVFFLLCFLIATASSQDFGRFEGTVTASWAVDGRNMVTTSEFVYFDPDGQEWFVPVGTITDGASVPSSLHGFYPPFTGKYRIAAVVHDHFCQTKQRTWEATHNVFFYAMRASGVVRSDALTIWSAVYLFGPRWLENGRNFQHAGVGISTAQQSQRIQEIKEWIDKNQPSKDELELQLIEGIYEK